MSNIPTSILQRIPLVPMCPELILLFSRLGRVREKLKKEDTDEEYQDVATIRKRIRMEDSRRRPSALIGCHLHMSGKLLSTELTYLVRKLNLVRSRISSIDTIANRSPSPIPPLVVEYDNGDNLKKDEDDDDELSIIQELDVHDVAEWANAEIEYDVREDTHGLMLGYGYSDFGHVSKSEKHGLSYTSNVSRFATIAYTRRVLQTVKKLRVADNEVLRCGLLKDLEQFTIGFSLEI